MTVPSNFRAANVGVIVCPYCGACDIPGASQTIERSPHGVLICSICSKSWQEQPAKKEGTV